MRVILLPGKIKFNKFERATEGLNNLEIVGIINAAENLKEEWNPGRTGFKTWKSEDLYRKHLRESYSSKQFDYAQYHKILDTVLSDPRTYYLLERILKSMEGTSVFNQINKLECIIWNSLFILHKTKPDKLYSPSTPHSSTYFLKE